MLSQTSVRNTCPSLTQPANFDSFWKQTLELLNNVPFAIEHTYCEETRDGVLLQRILFQSLDNVPIEGYLLSPGVTAHQCAPRPLIVYTHGYMSQCEVVWTWAKKGANVFGMDIRGCGRSKNAAPPLSKHGYIMTGMDTPVNSILRGAVCDYIRGIQVAHELLNGRQLYTVLYGKSFGGALASMGAALTTYADLLVAAVPTFAWMEGRRKLVSEGSGAEVNAYIAKHPEQEQHIMEVLSYFDTLNFANHIKCPSFIGVGLQDRVVPPETVYAFYNHLACEKQIRELPVSHSALPQENLWDNFENEWLQRILSQKN